MAKPAYAWSSPPEEAALGSLLLRLAEAVRPICAAEPRLLRLSSPVYAIGDLHGNLSALLSMESALWPSGIALAAARILFLGDYVDRGSHGTELMAYLLAAKLQRPNAVFMVRGNHEIREIQKMFSFYNECTTKYGDIEGIKIWNAINNVFDCLPLAAVIDDKAEQNYSDVTTGAGFQRGVRSECQARHGPHIRPDRVRPLPAGQPAVARRASA